MEEAYHIPAMLKETIEGLDIKPGGIYVDVTFGGGGHSRAILEAISKQPSDISSQLSDISKQPSDISSQLSGISSQLSDISSQRLEGSKQPSDISSQLSGISSQRLEGSKQPSDISSQPSGIRAKELVEETKDEAPVDHIKEEKPVEENPVEETPVEEASKQPSMTEGKQGHLYSFDQDEDALLNVQRDDVQCTKGFKLTEDERWTFVHSNFRYLRNWMDYYGVKEIDGLLADLGVSFHHFDCPERGFSFRFSAPLDMRMNQTAKRTAADIVNGYSEEELSRVFWLYGELKNGRQIARNVCRARAQKAIERTEELVAAVLRCKPDDLGVLGSLDNLGERKKDDQPRELNIPANAKKDMAKLFQALRIEVNDELGALREMLVAARDLLKPGGRIAILTYHSLEDRLVKNFLRSGNLEGEIEKDFYGNNMSPFEVIEKGREASAEEVEQNPRARSAKLRVAEKK